MEAFRESSVRHQVSIFLFRQKYFEVGSERNEVFFKGLVLVVIVG